MAGREQMADYEVRLFEADGTLALVMTVAADGIEDASAQANAMLREDIVKAELRSGPDLVEVGVLI